MEKKQGILIAFEGIDGTGKSTQVKMLAGYLRKKGYEVVETFEPTNGPYGKRIRANFSNRDTVSKEEELELFLSDRKEHVDQLIKPALLTGKVVITDRYYFSTAAYQGAVGFDPDEIIRKNEKFAPVPDIVFLLEAPVSVGIERIENSRGEELNAFEQEENLRKVAEIFSKLKGDNIIRVDGARPPEEVHSAIADIFTKVICKGTKLHNMI